MEVVDVSRVLSEIPEHRIELFGGSYQKARKPHRCWCCGKTIEAGAAYFKTVGKYNGEIFMVKHCRKTCECVSEMLDQNPHLGPRAFFDCANPDIPPKPTKKG